MARIFTTVIVIALFVIAISAIPGKRMRRGFNNSGYSGYGRGSDERDTSTSQEGNGCSSENSRSYSGSREHLGYSRDGRQSNENNRGSRSFAKSSASAAATSFNENHNSRNIIV